jgi:hypothetical protein
MQSSSKKPFFFCAASVAAAILVPFYLVQQLTMAPNHVDEGYLLESVRLAAQGQRVFWDFIDIYGPLNYGPPALFYDLSGGHAWGVRVWVLLVKLSAVAVTYPTLARLADRFSAWLCVAWLTVLLGLPWQALQMPFAFMHCVPLLLGTCALLIVRPFGRGPLDSILAGALTAMALLLKVSTGSFLLAAGTFYCAYWLPREHARAADDESARAPRWQEAIEVGALGVFGAAFLYLVRKKVDWLFYLYLDVPLLILLGWTWAHVRKGAGRASFRARARKSLEYFGSSSIFALLIGLWYFGWQGSLRYVREMRLLISVMLYEHPVLALGEPGLYRGFNEYYWMQLPWGITTLFLVWAVLGARGRGARTFGERWPKERARATGLFGFATLGMFVFYQFGTEVHLLSGLLGAGPCLFVLLFQIRRMLEEIAVERGKLRLGKLLRPGLGAAVAVWLSTIAYWPRLTALIWPPGDWTISEGAPHRPSDNRLVHLRFREPDAPGVNNFSEALPDDEWDRIMNEASMFVDEITEDGEEILVVSQDEIVPFHSFTRHVGGRYRLAFFWLRIGLLDREGFDRLVPREVLQKIIQHPPRVVVSAYGDMPLLLERLPELRGLGEKYRLLRSFGYIQILERNPERAVVAK